MHSSYPHYLMVFKNPSNGQIYAAIPSLGPSIQYAPVPLIAAAASHHHLPLAQPSVPTPYDGNHSHSLIFFAHRPPFSRT